MPPVPINALTDFRGLLLFKLQDCWLLLCEAAGRDLRNLGRLGARGALGLQLGVKLEMPPGSEQCVDGFPGAFSATPLIAKSV